MSLLAEIKKSAKATGGGLSKMFFVKDGEKRRVRFLTDFEDGIEIPWLSCYAKNIGCVNPEFFGKPNPWKDDPDVKEDTMYLWQVKDYDSNSVKPFMYKANNCSPVLNLAEYFETYNTITDRDYLITCNGVGAQRQMPVIAMDKQRLRDPIKKLSKEEIKKILIDAYSKYQGQGDEEDNKYVGMSRKKMYDLCIERKIKVKQQMTPAYYVALLEEYDAEEASKTGFDDAEVEDDWGDEEEVTPDYENMTRKELYYLCLKRKIKVQEKKQAIYYITLLEDYDKEKAKSKPVDDWDEPEEEDSWDDEKDEWEDDFSDLPFN